MNALLGIAAVLDLRNGTPATNTPSHRQQLPTSEEKFKEVSMNHGTTCTPSEL